MPPPTSPAQPLTMDDGEATRTAIIHDFLPCTLTQDERYAYGLECANEQRKLHMVEREKALAMAQFKEAIQDHANKIKNLSEMVYSGIEERSVECEKVYHYDISQVTITRMDTGDIVETRPMTRKEKQMEMEI